MKTESRDQARSEGKWPLWKTAVVAAALGVATWLLAPLLLPPRLPDDFPNLPDLHSVNPNLREVLRTADRDARRKPGSAEVVGKLGLAYHANLFLDQAARAYRIAARLAPDDSRWVYCQAFLAEENGDQEQERRLLEQTLRLKPDHVPALLKLADASFKLDRLDDAARYYDAALRAPGSAASLQANFGLARVAARRKDWNKVIAFSAPLARAYPTLLPPYELLLEAYEALGQPNQAAQARQGILSAKSKVVPPVDDPLNQELIDVCYSSTRLLKQAGVLSHLGYPDRALQLARRAAQAEPADPDVRNFIAHTLITAYPGKPEAVNEALTQLGECLRLRPDDVAPLWMFARDFFDVPEPPAAVEQIRAMMQPYAGRADAHLYLGLAAAARGETAEAISQYRAALKNDPNNAGVYSQLGVVLAKAGNFDEAIANLQHSVDLNSQDVTTRFNLGAVLLERGKDAQGLKELNEVLRLKPDYAAAHFCIAFACLYSKRVDDAVARFREGLRYGPDDAEAHFGLASALAMQGKREEAIAEVRQALTLRPDYAQAQQLLRQLQP
jgi:tetratricopeptide (TPR) repeat protein